MKKDAYWWRLLVAIDQLGNVAVFNGYPDETISSNAAKRVARGEAWAVLLCKLLHLFDKGHCAKSIELDEGRPA